MKKENSMTILMVLVVLCVVWVCLQQRKNDKQISQISESLGNLTVVAIQMQSRQLWSPADFAAQPSDEV